MNWPTQHSSLHGMESTNAASLLTPMDEDDDGATQENSIYFTNEEKLISNSLKVNFAAQLIIIGIFTLAVTLADWTHIAVDDPESSSYDLMVYHITLVTMEIGTSFDDFDISGDKFEWLVNVSEECDQPGAKAPYPEEVCK